MPRLQVGDRMPDFQFDTAFETGLSLNRAVKDAHKTALIFLRYYGCTLCQYNISQFATNYDKISAGGGQLLVVMQSAPEIISAQIREGSLPFPIICDPEQILYKRFDVWPAKSKTAMIDFRSVLQAVKAAKNGSRHGKYEGDELQLPATFIVDADRTLRYVRYAKHVADIPDIDELVKLLAL